MIEQNPFSSYSLEDQNAIADQLRTLKGSNQLNPDQLSSVDNALKYLPMSKAQADSNLLNLATHGAGTWTPPKQPSFQDTMYVDPLSKQFGGEIKNKEGNLVPHGELVDYRNVRQTRANLQSRANLPLSSEPEEGDSTGGLLLEGLEHLPDASGSVGRTLGELPIPKSMSKTRAISGATGEFFGRQVGDVNNLAILTTMGGAGIPTAVKTAAGVGFTGQMAYGGIVGAGQLGEIWDREDIPRERKIELGANVTLNILMAGASGGHTVKSLMGAIPESVVPAADRVEIAQKIESEWQQLPNGQMMRRRAEGVTTQVQPDAKTAGGPISKQFPPGSFFNRQIAPPVEGELPPPVNKVPRNMIRPNDAQAITGERNVQSQLGRYLIVPNRVAEQGTPSAPSEIVGRAVGGPDAPYIGRYNTRPPATEPAPPSVSGGSGPFDEASAREAVKKAGGEYVGIQNDAQDKPSLVLFNDPISKSTLGVPIDKFSQESVKARLDSHQVGQTPTATAQNPASPSVESPKSLSPTEKAALIKPDRTGVYDLRTVDPDTRHEWINKNVNFESKVPDAVAMMQEGRKLFGPDRHIGIVSYLDKDGNLHHGIKLFTDESGKPIIHPQPDTAPPGESSVSRLGISEAKTFADIQTSEAKFNERTGGKHSQVLTDLWKATEKALPPDTPHEGKLNLYKKGLDALHDALTSGKGLTDLYKAFDVVKKGPEAGFFGGKGRRRLSDEELDRLTRLHVDSQLSKWEQKGVSLPTLTKPAFRASVYGAGDPALELRYEELLKNGGEGTDPVGMLANVVSGVTNKWLAKDIKSEQLARAAMTHEQRKGQLEEYRHDWNSRGIEDTLLYYDAAEHGDIDSLVDEKDRESARILRTMLDQKRDQIQALGTGKLDHFIENYMGRMWKFGTKDVISQIAAMKRPFAGNASFLKQRSYEYFSDGIAAGLEPVTYNPIDMQLMKLHEMDRYLAAHTMFRDLKSYGLLREFADKDAPPHWGTIDDNMFRAGEGKHWYAPREVAAVFNNHLSPGLRTGTRGLLYNPVANYNNLLNQANLSMSVFHGFETGYYSFTSDFADVIGKVSRMDIPGLAKTGERWLRVDKGGPIAPLRHYLLGMKLQQEVMHPGQFAELSDDIDNLQKAGARIRMPEEFRNAAREGLHNAMLELRYKGLKVLGDNFAEMALDNPGVRAAKVATRAVGAMLEGMSVPIMEKWVPRIKLGVQLERQRDYISRNPDASPEQLRRGLRKIWDAVDDRFGEFTYDNLNIDRTYKDALHLMLRSVGWNFGTARTFVGAALPDVFNLRDPESLAGQITNKKYTGLTERQAFTLGLLGMNYISARILCGFFGTEPDEYTKMGYARTGGVNPDGSPSRIYVKNYVTDAYAMYHSPGQTTLNKLAPGWHMMGELYQNSDYWGNRIHPINPTTTDALTDPANYAALAKYGAKSMEPFSFTNFQQRRARGEGVLSSLTSAAAILPAPSYIGQTKASSLAFDLFRTTLPRGPNDPDVAAKLQRYHELASGFAAGTVKEKDIDKALDAHEITEKQYDGILAEDEVGKKDGDLSVLERHVKYLNSNDFLRVFDYADPRERAALEDRFYQKWDSAVKDGDEDLSKQFESREKLLRRK